MPKPGVQSKIRARRKHQIGNGTVTSARPRNETSQAALKKRVRDLTRLLKRPEKLPADVIQTRERELAACKDELESAKRHGGASKKMISKYHMVRFFERKKATRALKKAKKRLASNEDASKTEALQREVHNCQVDLDYTLYYPLNQKYTSLYKSGDEAGSSTQPLRDNAMWPVVEQAYQSNSLEALRDGKFPDASSAVDCHDISSTDAPPLRLDFHQKPNTSVDGVDHRHNEDDDDDNDDDDNGSDFFEK